MSALKKTIAVLIAIFVLSLYAAREHDSGNYTGVHTVFGSFITSGPGYIAATTAERLLVDPPPCDAGQFVNDVADDGTLGCGTPPGTPGNTWETHEIVDDSFFGGGVTSLTATPGHWYIPAGALTNVAEPGRSSVKLFTSAATSGSNSAMFSSTTARSGFAPNAVGVSSSAWLREWTVAFGETNNTVTQRLGLHCASSLSVTNPDQGIFFQRNAADTNWKAVTQTTDGSAETETDTGVAISTAWRKFKISRATNTANILFFIDGVQVASHSTNIPTQMCNDWILPTPTENVAKTVKLGHFHSEDPRL